MNVLPNEFQRDWQAELRPAEDHPAGVFRLVAIRRTEGGGFEGQRVTVLLLDEDGQALPSVPVAFSYSTARQYIVGPEFTWRPPTPRRADVFATQGGGQIDHVQGSVVKAGQPGGITAYVLSPLYASDVVSGLGMLADHSGVHLTFQLRRVGVVPLGERLASIEARLAALEAGGNPA
jgi:hypothetical protein